MLLVKAKPKKIRDIINPGKSKLIEFFKSSRNFANVYGPVGSGKSLSIRLVAKEYGYDIHSLTNVRGSMSSSSITGRNVLYITQDDKIFTNVLNKELGSNKVILESIRKYKNNKKVFYIKYYRISDDYLQVINPTLSKKSLRVISGDLRRLSINDDYIDIKENEKKGKTVFSLLQKGQYLHFIDCITNDSLYYLHNFWSKVMDYADILCEGNG